MDKMGSYDDGIHSNKGIPSTYSNYQNHHQDDRFLTPRPRNGCSIEIIALQHSILQWLARSFTHHQYPYEGVTLHDQSVDNAVWSFHDWARRIESNFESSFLVKSSSNGDVYYKDTFIPKSKQMGDKPHSVKTYQCDQLRPNYVCI